MDDDECPDSTVLMDDDDVDDAVADPFPTAMGGRRNYDEPQSSRITSTGVHYNSTANYPLLNQLPPLPKLIFRPPAHAGHYPSVSFSTSTSTSRLGSTSGSSNSRSDIQALSRLTSFPASRSESFPGTSGSRISMGLQSREIPLPRMEAISRSELTISRVGSASASRKSLPSTTSSTSRNEIPIARVGGVSISRVEGSGLSPFARVGASKARGPVPGRIALPTFSRVSASAESSSSSPQVEAASSSRKFGRRFLKSTPTPSKSQVPGVSRMPMVSMRASSTDEYFSPSQPSHVPSEDPLAMDSEATVDFSSRGPAFPISSTSSSFANATSTTILGSETLTSQQGSQGIKLHISKKPVEVIEVDESSSERSSNSLSSSLKNNSDSNIGLPFDFSSPPSVSVSANNSSSSMSVEEVSIKPVTIKVQKKERIPIPKEIVIEEEPDDGDNNVDDDDTKDGIMIVSDGEPDETTVRNIAFPKLPQHLIIESVAKEAATVIGLDDSSRRSRRKRQPTAVKVTPPKVRRKRGAAAVGDAVTPPSTTIEVVVTPPRGRGRGTGRGRGRPRGSTNKAKLERILLQQQESSPEKEPETKTEPVVDSTSPDIKEDLEIPVLLPLEGDPEVNAEVSSASPPVRKTRGRGKGSGTPRGTGTPRSSRTPRGGRGTRSPRGERKSPEAKKLKQEKKEAIKAPPPVQVFEEETRMSADIKPAVPDRITALATPVPLDEESRASNVSSTSTSTTAKAKRFTKDPIEERRPVTAETLFEYQWPPNDKNSEFYFLQEQISEYLGVKSFKRKYPDIRRRVVDMEERDFLRESKVVSETQCDLGLTAVHSCDVLDIMFNDFTEKYEEYRKVFQERKEQEMTKLKPTTEIDTPAVRDRSAEFMRRILKSCAKWNFNTNRDRMDERACAFDLQTGTLHYPKNKVKVLPSECTKIGKYPVAVLPGQFTDNFKEYTPEELNYLPLNTVRYGPVTENWVVNSDSSEESSDSEDSSSSDDSSSTSSDDDDGSIEDNEQNQVVLTDEAGNVMYRGISGLTKVSTDATCKSCDGNAYANKDGNAEVLLHCSRCDIANHPTCLELTLDMLPFITKYLWECTDCKNCIECNDPADEDKMLFCDCCDRGYHIYCVGLRKVPNGRWHCSVCSLCYSCGVTQPSPEDRMAEWHHEFRKGEKGSKFYLHSFCVACHKLYKKGQFCPSCMKPHTKLGGKDLLECRKCEKWVHRACVKRSLKSMFGFMCDPCDANFRSRSTLPSHVN